MKLPDGWQEVLQRARDNICPGGDGISAAHERQIVEPYIDWIFDELADLEAGCMEVSMIYEKPLRRDCIDCQTNFKIIDECEFRCATCKEKIRKMQLRVEAGNSLLDACDRVK